MDSKIYLETPRFILREAAPADRAEFKNLDSDPEVMKYLTDGQPSSDQDVEAGMSRTMAYYKKFPNRLGLWPAISKNTGEFVGWFLLRPSRKDPENIKDLELGYRLKKKFWRQGIANEVSSRLIDKAFLELGADAVHANTMLKNEASWGAMKKLGMKLLHEYQEEDFPGSDKQAVRYSISRKEWQARRSV